ncbi:methyltransferase domain-containing protein [Halorhabdus sp. CBA1104]|uniref:class I SAM-dependent methyltransferase n=1 Tax=unclassified Halorhabdus TaxID=2621901 RepID=UPI0012B310E6|nr:MULTISPECIES: methyltransferase domain-containing protein [unclassified Halorhabdus]QGN06188.1 methyltransferase domain-containing protein [Halorhabdus sp. CBA1104]
MPTDRRAIRQFYDRIAGPYDRLASGPVVRRWRLDVIDALALQPGDVVVEMGCGTGANLSALRQRVGEGGRVLGIDLTPGMLERARRRVDRAGWENVTLLTGDARDPPIEGGVDAVLGTFVVGLFDDPVAVVEAWFALLAGGGRLGLLDGTLSDRLAGRPLNLGFRAFTRLSAPSSRGDRVSPAVTLARRVRDAHDRVLERSHDGESSRRALGLVRQSSGRIE